jgi:hypothetical protein
MPAVRDGGPPTLAAARAARVGRATAAPPGSGSAPRSGQGDTAKDLCTMLSG